MLLGKERERLREVLSSRTASHGEKRRARELLEEDAAQTPFQQEGTSSSTAQPAQARRDGDNSPTPSP
jgi:hypothetical protein